jgi:DNA integrity scanning protein DisA with diadenylate cyclase activity
MDVHQVHGLAGIGAGRDELAFALAAPLLGIVGIDHVAFAIEQVALAIALEIAAEGREAQAVGTMFVIGDSRNVQRQAQQLVLNPFHGYSRQLRNVLDPSLAETIKEFALIDGAFIIQGDGTVLSAGTYLMPKAAGSHLPHGLGARHQTAAAITAHTLAMSITVSQSTGTVTVFRNGSIVFSLERAAATRW